MVSCGRFSLSTVFPPVVTGSTEHCIHGSPEYGTFCGDFIRMVVPNYGTVSFFSRVEALRR